MTTYHKLQAAYTVKIQDKTGNPPSTLYPDIPKPPTIRVSIIAGHTVEIANLAGRADIADRRHVELARELVALIATLESKVNALTDRLEALQ